LGSNAVLVYAANTKLGGAEEPVWCEHVEYGFVAFFVLEMVVKVLAVGAKGYVRTPWWTFDCIIAVASTIGVVLDLQTDIAKLQQTSVPLRMAKVLRTVRLIRVVSRVKKFRMIVGTSTKFFPHLPRFLLLFLTILYVYMIIGIETFGVGSLDEWKDLTANTSYAEMIYEVPSTTEGGPDSVQELSYVEYVNFQSPQNSMILLFTLLMVNNWHVLHDAVEVSGRSARLTHMCEQRGRRCERKRAACERGALSL